MSAYCTRSDANAIFGTANITAWATLDSTDTAGDITARVTAGIAAVSAEIDDYFRTSHYTLPLANSSGSTPTTVTDWAARLLGCWLYEARGVQDYNDQTGAAVHRLIWHRGYVRRAILETLEGKRKLDAL